MIKIYFEDGQLRKNPEDYGVPKDAHVIDASEGYSNNKFELKEMLSLDELNECDIIVYTNSIAALSNDYCWSSESNAPELYLRTLDNKFMRVDQLTDKEIRKAHNLMKMYMNRAFGYYPKFK